MGAKVGNVTAMCDANHTNVQEIVGQLVTFVGHKTVLTIPWNWYIYLALLWLVSFFFGQTTSTTPIVEGIEHKIEESVVEPLVEPEYVPDDVLFLDIIPVRPKGKPPDISLPQGRSKTSSIFHVNVGGISALLYFVFNLSSLGAA
jgi:hypothetical protein